MFIISVHDGQQKLNLRHNEKDIKWVGRTAGNSESEGNDGRYQDWYKFGEQEGKCYRFQGLQCCQSTRMPPSIAGLMSD